MAYDKLKELSDSYPPQARDALPQLAGRYRRRHERETLEVAAIAADVSLDNVVNLGLEPEADPQFLEAFRLQYPNVEIDSLRGATEEQLEGWANGSKGKYFEVLVRDKLNAGETVGGITLGPGEVADLAGSPVEPGWDLEIVNKSTGDVVEQVQLKATDSLGYAKSALEKYPNIPVMVPQELQDEASGMDALLSADISNEELEDMTGEQLAELSESVAISAGNQISEFALDAIPIGSAVCIGVIEGAKVMLGTSTVEESFKRGRVRLARSAVYTTIGAALTAAGAASVVSIPAVTALKIAEGRVGKRAAMGEQLDAKTQEILRELNAGAAVSA